MSNKTRWAVTAISIIIAFIAIAAAFVGIFSDGFTNWNKFKPEEEQTETADNGGMIVGSSVGNGISLKSMKIAAEDYAAYGVSPLAESAQTLTAIITPSNAVDKTVDWAVAWVDASSSWANGKTVTDYVTVTPTSDGALTATVECLQDFGEQIKVTVSSRSNSSAKAEATVDYQKRLLSVDGFEFYVAIDESGSGRYHKGDLMYESGSSDYTFEPYYPNGVEWGLVDQEAIIEPVVTYSAYTIDVHYNFNFYIQIKDELASAFESAGFELNSYASSRYDIERLPMIIFLPGSFLDIDSAGMMQIFAKEGDVYERYAGVMKEFDGHRAFTFSYSYDKFEGGSYTASFDFGISADFFPINVSSVTLNTSSLVF